MRLPGAPAVWKTHNSLECRSHAPAHASARALYAMAASANTYDTSTYILVIPLPLPPRPPLEELSTIHTATRTSPQVGSRGVTDQLTFIRAQVGSVAVARKDRAGC